MCVAVPGKVVSVNGRTAEVDYNGTKVTARAGLVDVKPGDYALIHAGLIIQVLKEDEALNISHLFDEIEEVTHDAAGNN